MAKRNLLLVDADPRSLRVLEVSLRKAGYSVATCPDVDNALELIGLSEPDMVIADTRLPGKDGLALARELRSRPSTAQLPLMFLSSDPSVETKVKALELGIEDYLTKPAYMREILTRVNLIMERSEREGLGRAAKTRFSGSLEDMGLIDLLQTIEVSRKSGVLKLSHGQRRGAVTFLEGRVIDAELGTLHGEAAIYRFLLWNEGAFELEFREVRGEDKLGIPTQALLMEGVRRLDEWGRLQEQLPGLHAILEVDHSELGQRIGEVPDELNGVLRAFDGQRDLIQVLETSEGDDLATLTAVSKLFFDGFLMVRHRTDPSEARVGATSDPFIGYVPADSSPPRAAVGALDAEALAVPVARVPSLDEHGLSRPTVPTTNGASTLQPGAVGGTGHVPLAVLKLKRAPAINGNAPRLQPAVESERGEGDRPASSRATHAGEGEEHMATSGKRTERPEGRSGGTVIPLHAARSEPVLPAEASLRAEFAATVRPEADEEAAPAADLTHEDDHPEVQHFFSAPERASAPVGEPWGELEGAEHDHELEPGARGGQRAMAWTAAIAGGGLLLIGAFLVYHKLLMPTPEDLGPASVALPTPDMLQPALRPSPEPGPASPESPSRVTPTDEARDELPAQPELRAAAQDDAPGVQGDDSAGAGTSPGLPATAAGAAASPSAVTTAPTESAPAALPAGAAPQQPGVAKAYAARLTEARKAGLRRQAEQLYVKALAAKPDGAEALSGLAMFYLNQGKSQQALERAGQAVASDPRSSEGWIVLGAAHDALGNRAAARAAYEKCAALAPDKYVTECKRMLH